MVLGKPWTPEEDSRLRALIDQGARYRDIAIELRRSESAVRHRAKYLSIYRPPSKRRWTPDEDRIIRRMWASATIKQIAEHLPGRTPAAVRKRALVQLGLPSRAQLPKPQKPQKSQKKPIQRPQRQMPKLSKDGIRFIAILALAHRYQCREHKQINIGALMEAYRAGEFDGVRIVIREGEPDDTSRLQAYASCS